MTDLLKTICLGTVLAWSAASCSSDVDLTDFDAAGQEVAFTAMQTRATGTAWTAGDHIGVYMKAAGTALEGTQLTGTTANVDYVTAAGDGRFAAAGAKLYYPHDGAAVDFVAYYPYTASVAAGVYPVNVADQADAEAIDLMYADNLKEQTKASGTGALAFSHQLATVSLTVKSADGNALDGMKISVADAYTTASFNLSDATFTGLSAKADVPMNVIGTGTTLTATALLIPNVSVTQDTKPLSVKFTSADGKTQTVRLADNLPLEKGRRYTYTVSVKNSGSAAQPVTYARWTETPVITADQLASDHLKYITHSFTDGGKQVRNYAMLYDTDLKMAYWVAYPLCNYYTKKNVSRTDDWGFDPALANSLQADMSKGIGGYDRGHQLPSADRLVTREANVQTFYYTNMTPQVGTLNQGIWSSLEDKLRSWSSSIDTLYVVTGASATSSLTATDISYTRDVAGARIAVPKYYYKALLKIDRETGTAYTIAFKFDNTKPASKTIMDYAISVAELEALTGFTFFPGIAASAKQSYDTKKWQ